MIVDAKHQAAGGVDGAAGADDAPPAYDVVSAPATSSIPDTKRRPAPSDDSHATGATQAGPSAATLGLRSASPAQAPSWFSFLPTAARRTDKDVKRTVLGLVRDIVKQGSVEDAIPILQSCAEACRARGLLLEAILQERSIEGHTPLYWAIVKGAPPGARGALTLADLLMSFPLQPAALAEARAACMAASDDGAFQRLRRSAGAAGARALDDLLLGAPPADEVTLSLAPGTSGAFRAQIRLAGFQQRARVTRSARAEFVARGRIWALEFVVSGEEQAYSHGYHPPGSWFVLLRVLERSPPTPLDARIRIAGPDGGGAEPIELRFKTIGGSSNVGEPTGNCWVDSTYAYADLRGTGLEFDGCPLLDPDGSLTVVIEAQLAKPPALDGDCIIC